LIKYARAIPETKSVVDGAVVVRRTLQILDVVKKLKIEKRRVYDVLNILESLRVLSRVKKDTFAWEDTAPMLALLSELRNAAKDASKEEDDQVRSSVVAAVSTLQAAHAKKHAKKKPSVLSALTTRVVTLLAEAEKDGTQMSLANLQSFFERNEAADDDDNSDSSGDETPAAVTKQKTSMTTMSRRLYDVVGVLSAIGLIKHEHVGSTTSTTSKKTLKVIRLCYADERAEEDLGEEEEDDDIEVVSDEDE
jgi:hypothetical protein